MQAPFLDVNDGFAGADSEAEDDEGDDGDDGVAGDGECAVFDGELEDAVASDEEENHDEGHFGEASENT